MISLVLLLKIIGGVCLAGSWGLMYRAVRRTEGRLECLREHCEERLTVLAEAVALLEDSGVPEDDNLAEAKRKAVEAERLFTEGIASILNFNASLSSDRPVGYGMSGKKGA